VTTTSFDHEVEVRVHADAEALADAAAELVVDCAAAAIAAHGRFVLALAGGSTPRALYENLARDPWRERIDWARVHVVWGDERAVPPDHAQSNYRMAREVLLDHVPVPPGQVHRIPGEIAPDAAALAYEAELRAVLGLHDAPGTPAGALDLALLGLGADGHTASLFPGRPTLHERHRWVLADDVDGRGTWRISLTPPCLNAATTVVFVVAGDAKAAVVHQVLDGEPGGDPLPAQLIAPPSRLVWMLDRAAAARLARP
jgi:6-phosphogluconolactonase